MGQRALFNVLKAFSVYDPTVGYCQGPGLGLELALGLGLGLGLGLVLGLGLGLGLVLVVGSLRFDCGILPRPMVYLKVYLRVYLRV